MIATRIGSDCYSLDRQLQRSLDLEAARLSEPR